MTAVLVDLEDFRSSKLDALEAASEAETGKALVTDWTRLLWDLRDPTQAHLLALSEALDEASAAADSFESLVWELGHMASAARAEAARRAKR